MQKLLNPKLLFLVNTLPLAVLFLIFLGQFSIINTLLTEDELLCWKVFGISLVALGALSFAYAVYLIVKKKHISVIYGLIALICHIAFIYLSFLYSNEIIPLSIPGWMVSGNLLLYVLSFLMPTIAYSMFILIAHFTPEAKEHSALRNFLISISIPVVIYLIVNNMVPWVWRIFVNFGSLIHIHGVIVFFIVITLVFFFFLVRTLFIIIAKKEALWQKYQLVWKIIIAIALPLLGLNTLYGIFDSEWFIVVAIFNGILICLPNFENKFYRLSLFALRCIAFTYTLYFFLVFLPFLPISIIALLLIGTGFLMLAPLLLFTIHVAEISKDFEYLRTWFSKKSLFAILALGFLVIPACVTAVYLRDKSVLNEALEYSYSPDYSKQYSINKKSLKKTLKIIDYHQIRRRNGREVFSHWIPYLTPYFNWLVLDNQSLSKTKSNYMKQVFFGRDSTNSKLGKESYFSSSGVKIIGIRTNSIYDKSQNAWKSWVNLEIMSNNWSGSEEYTTTIDLPEGCWISDYYLDIENRREHGILAEKKTAMWVYSNIVNENKDPGILYYLEGNKVALKVFPVSTNGTRKTGIEFLHKEPVKLTIDGNVIELGYGEETSKKSVETENFAYVSVEQKQKLKAALRKPYFHFLIDASADKEKDSAYFAKRIESLLTSKPEMRESTQISYVSTYVNDKPNYEGGFYLERGIETVLFNAYKNKTYPIIVVVTDSIENAILEKNFSDFKFAYPESDLFFELNPDGYLYPHSLSKNPKFRLPYFPYSFEQNVLIYRFSDNSFTYLPNDNEPSIALKNDAFKIAETEIKEKNWQSALSMQAMRMSHTLHPEKALKEWQNLVKYSFISKIMTPETSYLVVENEAQKAALQSKQKEVLSGNKNLDLDGDTQRMSEPNSWILIILLCLALAIKHRNTHS